ncbi:aldo/keto reductase [Cohnella sp. GCM10027633]|uniref:aldo/keto reductase n=1 Tax=unclassified Cohnella TaxID=2636738 RepID=UPI003627F04C
MRIRHIPGTTLQPSVIGLGTADFGTALDRERSFGLLDRYIELGGTLIDTAHVYGDWAEGGTGASERTVGSWLRERGGMRDRIVLSTKGAHPPLNEMSRPRLDEEAIRSDLFDSLERLQTDRIDLYWLHRDDPARSVEAIMESLHEHVIAGRIRYVGASNWTPERIEAANRYAAANGLTPFIGSQPHWNLASLNPVLPPDNAAIDDREQDWYADSGVAVFAYSAQASGFFGGKYDRNRQPSGGRSSIALAMYANDTSYDRLERARELAAALGVSSSQVALAYLVSQPFPVYALIGPNKLEHLEDSCQAGDLVLTPRQLAYLKSGQPL